MSACTLYAIACAGPEDIMKIGMANDPLTRWAAFHPRWVEYFSLEASALVVFDSRGEARRAETAMHRALADFRCPAPLETRHFAGGVGEWYRGASAIVTEAIQAWQAQGITLVPSVGAWAQHRMALEVPKLLHLLQQAETAHYAHLLQPSQRAALRDLLACHTALDAGLVERLGVSVDWL